MENPFAGLRFLPRRLRRGQEGSKLALRVVVVLPLPVPLPLKLLAKPLHHFKTAPKLPDLSILFGIS